MYFSKDVYKHKECIEIDVTKKCYVAEICSQISDNEDKRTTRPISTTTNSIRSDDRDCDTENTCIGICGAVAALLSIILILTISLITIYVRNEQKRKRRNKGEKEENCPLLPVADDDMRGVRKCIELPGLSALKKSAEFFHFNRFVTELSTEINREDKLQDLKNLALGVEVTHKESLHSAEDFLKFLVLSHSLHKNLVYLQVLFIRVNAINLTTLCMKFGENHRLLYLELKQTSKGDEYIIHHFEAFGDADLDSLRNAVCTMLETDEQRIRIQSM
ncbi:uncharacterized protein LOC133183556 [Saccostrea echinata]|uniref:uncharacterized protein LOC133183556 n=1 Tax=Saccostrea echinata TaxID=191078 RepID=UPI002A82BAE0|nr:uncharacterized protein LOC133183556 [Saccostrea echinata]